MGQSIIRNQKTSVNWMMGMPISTKKYLSLQKLLYSGKPSQVQKIAKFLSFGCTYAIPNKKKICQINFSEYRSFNFRKTLNFIIFIEILAFSMHNFSEWQNLKKLSWWTFVCGLNSLFCKINFRKFPQNSGNSRNFILRKFLK